MKRIVIYWLYENTYDGQFYPALANLKECEKITGCEIRTRTNDNTAPINHKDVDDSVDTIAWHNNDYIIVKAYV